MQRLATIHIRNQYLKFSAAHFTIFSATDRERLHGHNFAVSADVTAPVADDGLCFDYNLIKKRLRALCDGLDEYLLLPAHSPHLSVDTSTAGQVTARFADEVLQFLATDTQVLPLANITAEELSWWLLQQLVADELVAEHDIRALRVAVASGAGQSASSSWSREDENT